MKNLKYKTISADVNSEWFVLEIHLTEICNYNCSYCNLHQMNRYDKIDYEKLFSIPYPKNTKAFILGGEPTVDKNLIELVKKLNENGICNVEIQTNLSTNIEKIVDTLKKNNLSVKFFSSFHNEFADFKSFITKNNFLVSSGFYAGIHYMWSKKFSALSLTRFNLLNSLFDNVSLEPLLPHSFDEKEWDAKEELHAFSDLGLMQYSKRMNPIIKIDNKSMSIGDALLHNYERGLFGISCSIPKYAITFSVTKNKFFNCCFDLVANREFVYEQWKTGSCQCVHKMCCADIEYPKNRA